MQKNVSVVNKMNTESPYNLRPRIIFIYFRYGKMPPLLLWCNNIDTWYTQLSALDSHNFSRSLVSLAIKYGTNVNPLLCVGYERVHGIMFYLTILVNRPHHLHIYAINYHSAIKIVLCSSGDFHLSGVCFFLLLILYVAIFRSFYFVYCDRMLWQSLAETFIRIASMLSVAIHFIDAKRMLRMVKKRTKLRSN